jgi:NADH:ubiquinone oxidoreductase subunit 3 (subunit A)
LGLFVLFDTDAIMFFCTIGTVKLLTFTAFTKLIVGIPTQITGFGFFWHDYSQ